MTQPLVVIARIHGANVLPGFFQSYEQLVEFSRGKGIQLLPAVVERLHVDRARNEVVEMLLHPEKPRPPLYPEGVNPIYKQATHIFFVDDDMLFPPSALVQLLAHDLPIVGGLYYGRSAPHLPIAYRKVFDNQWVATTKFCPGLQEVDAIGAGCLLIKREVFEKLSRPWFEFSDRMGEDMWFCERAREAGYPIVLDADVKARHLSIIDIGEEHFSAHRERGLTFAPVEGFDIQALSEEVRPYRPKRNRAHLTLLAQA